MNDSPHMPDTNRTNAGEHALTRQTYTMAEVATMLGLGIHAVYRMARANAFPVLRAGKRWLAPRAAFDDWLNGRGGKVGIGLFLFAELALEFFQ